MGWITQEQSLSSIRVNNTRFYTISIPPNSSVNLKDHLPYMLNKNSPFLCGTDKAIKKKQCHRYLYIIYAGTYPIHFVFNAVQLWKYAETDHHETNDVMYTAVSTVQQFNLVRMVWKVWICAISLISNLDTWLNNFKIYLEF